MVYLDALDAVLRTSGLRKVAAIGIGINCSIWVRVCIVAEEQ